MDRTVGVLGGGQLGRMLTGAANNLNIPIVTLDSENCPAKQVAANGLHIPGSFNDAKAIEKLAEKADVITAEIEHINTEALQDLEERQHQHSTSRKVDIQPDWRTIRIIQNKVLQKDRLSSRGIPVTRFKEIENRDVRAAVEELGGFPVMLKNATGSYDGRGNFPLKRNEDIPEAEKTMSPGLRYLEAWADFTAELACMVVKVKAEQDLDWTSATLAYPVVETVHQDSICKLVYAPARRLDPHVLKTAQDLARKAVSTFRGKGIFGVEMFYMRDGTLMINEIAPRPHNSGHYTIEACAISQFEAHLRAILDLPISMNDLEADRPSVMLNILGGAEKDTHMKVAKLALSVPRAAIHLYGKGDGRPGRKMGHVTVTAANLQEAELKIQPLVDLVDSIRDERLKSIRKPAESTSLPKASQESAAIPSVITHKRLVAVTMGSDSDLKTLKPGIELLREFHIEPFVTITSAHRTPDRMVSFAKGAASNGFKVIIAAAGGAAHLPGMVAAISRLPVIGVPVKASVLDGHDSLLSIVQMPKGCPVATVAINNSNNAAQLAIRILALSDPVLKDRLEKYLSAQTQSVIDKAEKLEAVGVDEYS